MKDRPITSGEAGRGVRARLAKHGLRTVCPGCGHESRHFQRDGRLRESKCVRCGQTPRSKAWAEKNPGRWQMIVHEIRAQMRLFD